MKKYSVFVFITFLFALPANKYNLLMARGSLTENAVTLLMDKQYSTGNIEYEILFNGKLSGTTTKTNFTISNLLPDTLYNASHLLKNVSFTNILLPENAKVVINDA